MKLTRVANAFDCCKQLSKELTKDKTDYFTQLKHQRSELLMKKSAFTTDRIFVCLGIEDKAEYNVISSTHQRIFYINRTNIPDIKPIKDTHRLYQIQASLLSSEFTISYLPCSCLNCRTNPSDINTYLHKDERNIEKRKFSVRNDDDDNNNDDDISNLTCKEL